MNDFETTKQVSPLTNSELERALEAIDAYFRSGNSVPVERATIKASEWHALKAALSTEAQPEVTGAVARIGVDSCGGEPVVEIYCNFPDGIHDLYLSSAIQAAVRDKLEEVAKLVETMQKYPIGYKRRNISIPQAIRALIEPKS